MSVLIKNKISNLMDKTQVTEKGIFRVQHINFCKGANRMTYGEYIEILYSTGFWGRNKLKFAYQLFLAAGPQASITEDGVKTWLHGPKNYRTSAYFPDGSMKDDAFIQYIKSRTKDRSAWKGLQKAFLTQKTTDSGAEDFRVDLKTEDSEVFYWSLLNQFQRIFHLPESEREIENSETSLTTAPQHKSPNNEEIRDFFLKATSACEVMDTINRKPAILNRDDSAKLNAFLDRMDFLIPYTAPCNDLLLSTIRSFIEALRIQVLSLDATLNSRFGFDNDAAFVNMEDDKDWNKNREKGRRKKGRREKGRSPKLPELSLDLILESADPVNMAKLAVLEWGNFQGKMNQLFSEISSWQIKS